jgi:hypothetical protein
MADYYDSNLLKRLNWDWKPPRTGIHKLWYDGPILAIWIGFFCIDLSYTRLASWALRNYFED